MMKSLLVDALREKNDDSDRNDLSDSGSYSIPRACLETTSESDADLELMATGAFLVANDDVPGDVHDVTKADEFAAAPGDGAMSPTTDSSLVPARDSLPSMPPVARYVPIACIALALTAAIVWLAIQKLELYERNSQLGTATGLLRGDNIANDGDIEPTMPRFRYLDADGEPLDDEVWQ